jgi:hypothetical protein
MNFGLLTQISEFIDTNEVAFARFFWDFSQNFPLVTKYILNYYILLACN